MTDAEQDALICDRAFLRDKSWGNLPSGTPMAQKLQQKFPPFVRPPLYPRWYVDTTHNQYASCTRSACVDGKCLWHVKLIEEKNGRLAVRFEYDLAPRRVK